VSVRSGGVTDYQEQGSVLVLLPGSAARAANKGSWVWCSAAAAPYVEGS
jgi:hypothetical protein